MSRINEGIVLIATSLPGCAPLLVILIRRRFACLIGRTLYLQLIARLRLKFLASLALAREQSLQRRRRWNVEMLCNTFVGRRHFAELEWRELAMFFGIFPAERC